MAIMVPIMVPTFMAIVVPMMAMIVASFEDDVAATD